MFSKLGGIEKGGLMASLNHSARGLILIRDDRHHGRRQRSRGHHRWNGHRH